MVADQQGVVRGFTPLNVLYMYMYYSKYLLDHYFVTIVGNYSVYFFARKQAGQGFVGDYLGCAVRGSMEYS